MENLTVTRQEQEIKHLNYRFIIKERLTPKGWRPTLRLFIGRSQKASRAYYFSDVAQLKKEFERYKRQAETRAARKEALRLERKQFQPNINVGDIYYACWGYNQTNIDFFQVIKKVGEKTAVLREIYSKISSHSSNGDMKVIADKDNYKSPTLLRRRVTKNGIKIDHRIAWRWDGSPLDETGYSNGH